MAVRARSWPPPPINSTISSAKRFAACRCSERGKVAMNDKILLGAVAYDPKVVTIWDGFREWFERSDLPFDYVLFSNYEQQVESHLAGHVNVAWNSPLAWIEAKEAGERAGRRARAIAMRDTDQDLTSVIAVRADSALRSLSDLQG